MSGSKLGWNHRVCSTCLVQNLDGITLYVQVVNTSCLAQKFWMDLQEDSIQNFEPDMKY
jgi:hypothetical protein